MKYLQKEPVNLTRQPEIDIAKAVSLFIMIMFHSLHTFSAWGDDPISFIIGKIDYLQLLGSPVFLFCLGVGIVYTSKSRDAFALFKIGLKLLIIAYVLNFLRFGISALILNATRNLRITIESLHFGNTDILHCAALSYFVFALANKLRVRPWMLFVFAAVICVIGFLSEGKSTGNVFTDALFGLFWKTTSESGFPFMTMFIHCVSGYIFALFLIRCENKIKYYLCTAAVGVVLIINFWIFIFGQFIIFKSDEYRSYGIDFALRHVGETLITIAACYFISLIMPKPMINITRRLSTEVTSIYVIHWLLLAVISTLFEAVSALFVTVIAIVLYIISDLLSIVYYKKKASILSDKRTSKSGNHKNSEK